MTTLSIRLDDRTAQQLARLSESENRTAEDLLSEYAEQLVGLVSTRDIAERNAEKLRQAGYTTEEEVQEMIHAEIKAYRAENRDRKEELIRGDLDTDESGGAFERKKRRRDQAKQAGGA